jgi:hypothetical protein
MTAMRLKSIERFFLNTLLRISIAGMLLILSSDFILYPEDSLSLVIDVVVLVSFVIAYFLRSRFPTAAVFTISLVILAAMIYQCLAVPVNTTTSLSIILVVGFIFSVMLRGVTMWVMNSVALLAVEFIFVLQVQDPTRGFSSSPKEIVTVAITYTILYVILAYATYVLKSGYDKLYDSLRETSRQYAEKANEVVAQNEELLQAQENLNSLNANLEQVVNERTAKIQKQNEVLMKYSYANAHHLRGPVARLLGLASLSEIDAQSDPHFIIAKMKDQALEIDTVVRSINSDLESTEFASGLGA